METLKHLGAYVSQHSETIMWIALHLAAAAFILAWLGTWIYHGIRRWRVRRGHREAQRQLQALEKAREHALTHRVVSERRKDAA